MKGDILNNQSCWLLVFLPSQWFKVWPCGQLYSIHVLMNEDWLYLHLSFFSPTWLFPAPPPVTSLLTGLLWQRKKIWLNQFDLPVPQNWWKRLKNDLENSLLIALKKFRLFSSSAGKSNVVNFDFLSSYTISCRRRHLEPTAWEIL